MLRASCESIPLEIEEAALVDAGGSRWQAFRYVLLLLSRVGVLAAGIIKVFAFTGLSSSSPSS